MIYVLSVFILIINSRYWYILSVNILKFNNRYWYIVSVTSKCNTTSCYRYLSKLSTLPRSLTGYNHTFNINTHTLGTSHKLRHQKGEGGGVVGWERTNDNVKPPTLKASKITHWDINAQEYRFFWQKSLSSQYHPGGGYSRIEWDNFWTAPFI